jgi:hypothetical protein
VGVPPLQLFMQSVMEPQYPGRLQGWLTPPLEQIQLPPAHTGVPQLQEGAVLPPWHFPSQPNVSPHRFVPVVHDRPALGAQTGPASMPASGAVMPRSG